MIPVIILAAGHATRMKASVPKPLLLLKEVPLLVWQLRALEGLTKSVTVVIDQQCEQFIEAVRTERFSFQFHWVRQDTAVDYGTGAALLAANPPRNNSFLVLLGDCYYAAEDLRRLVKHSPAMLVRRPNPNDEGGIRIRRGVINTIIDRGPRLPYANTGAVYLTYSICGEPCRDSDTGEDSLVIRLNSYVKHHRCRAIITTRWTHLTWAMEYNVLQQYGFAVQKECVNLWHKKGKKILVMQRSDEPWTSYPNHLQLIGGHVEKKETPLEAIRRELREELGIELGASQLCLHKVMHLGKKKEYVFTTSLPIKNFRLREGRQVLYLTKKELLEKEMIPSDRLIVLKMERGT